MKKVIQLTLNKTSLNCAHVCVGFFLNEYYSTIWSAVGRIPGYKAADMEGPNVKLYMDFQLHGELGLSLHILSIVLVKFYSIFNLF